MILPMSSSSASASPPVSRPSSALSSAAAHEPMARNDSINSPSPRPGQDQVQDQVQGDHNDYVSYEEMICAALAHAQDAWEAAQADTTTTPGTAAGTAAGTGAGTGVGKPFPGVPPKQVFEFMVQHYAHLLPATFRGSATQALKKAVKKGLVSHLYRAYALNPHYHGKLAPGRVKPNVWTNKLRLEDEHDRVRLRYKHRRNKVALPQAEPPSPSPPAVADPLSDPLPDPTFFLSRPASSADDTTRSHHAVAASAQSSDLDTDFAAQMLLAFSTPPPLLPSTHPCQPTTHIPHPPPPPTCLSPVPIHRDAFPSSFPSPPPALPTPSHFPTLPCSSFKHLHQPQVPGSCAATVSSSPSIDASTWLPTSRPCSQDTRLTPPLCSSNPPRSLFATPPELASPAAIVDSIMFAGSAVSELAPTDPQQSRPTTWLPPRPASPKNAPYPVQPFSPSLAMDPPLGSCVQPRAELPPPPAESCDFASSQPVAWLPVRVGPGGQLVLPDGWAFLKPSDTSGLPAQVRGVGVAVAGGGHPLEHHVSGVGRRPQGPWK